MAESTIITGQFVRISQTPASIGERLMALIIDYFLIGLYILSTITLLSKLSLPSGFSLFFFLCVVYLPILGYSFLCEMFNHGQSFGKKLINIRVVKVDGSTPSIGSYLLRWLLFPIDGPITSGLGLLVVLLNKNNQRLGDLAAGTMVIKEKNYRKIHVSLDEFDYLTQNYHPVYPQSADLSLEQDVSRHLPKKYRNYFPLLPVRVIKRNFFRQYFAIISIMHWKKYNQNTLFQTIQARDYSHCSEN